MLPYPVSHHVIMARAYRMLDPVATSHEHTYRSFPMYTSNEYQLHWCSGWYMWEEIIRVLAVVAAATTATVGLLDIILLRVLSPSTHHGP